MATLRIVWTGERLESVGISLAALPRFPRTSGDLISLRSHALVVGIELLRQTGDLSGAEAANDPRHRNRGAHRPRIHDLWDVAPDGPDDGSSQFIGAPRLHAAASAGEAGNER